MFVTKTPVIGCDSAGVDIVVCLVWLDASFEFCRSHVVRECATRDFARTYFQLGFRNKFKWTIGKFCCSQKNIISFHSISSVSIINFLFHTNVSDCTIEPHNGCFCKIGVPRVLRETRTATSNEQNVADAFACFGLACVSCTPQFDLLSSRRIDEQVLPCSIGARREPRHLCVTIAFPQFDNSKVLQIH